MTLILKKGSDTLTLSNYIAFGSFTLSYNDVDGPNAGRALNGKMIRDKVASKIKITCTTIPITKTIMDTILPYLNQESFNITLDGTTYNVYSNNNSASHVMYKTNDYYKLSINIVEM